MTMTDERLAELDVVMAKARALPFATVEWEVAFTVARLAAYNAYPDMRAHIDAQAATIARATEMLAKLIYSEWQGQAGFVPWVENGNSFKQDDARDIARAALTGAA